MGLSGTLEAFPLSEVLRLLARSGQTGRLYAQSGVKEMRAYLVGGRLIIAWDGSDEALGDELVDRGLITAEAWEEVAVGTFPCEQALMEGVSPLEFDRAVRDITIGGLAKMVDGRSGTFAFEDGNTTALRLGTDLELDAVLAGVDERLQEWRRLRAIVPDLSQTLEFRRAIAGETVEMSPNAWNLLVALLPEEPLDSLIQLTGRSSTAVIEDLVELIEAGRAQISGYVTPAVVDAEFEEAEMRPAGDGTEHLAYVGDDPLGGFGPIGWENELGAIPASDETEPDSEDSLPLLGDDEASFLVDSGQEPGGFDFGLVGLDVAPNKGRNLLEKDNTWDAFSDFLEADEADPTPTRTPPPPSAEVNPGTEHHDGASMGNPVDDGPTEMTDGEPSTTEEGLRGTDLGIDPTDDGDESEPAVLADEVDRQREDDQVDDDLASLIADRAMEPISAFPEEEVGSGHENHEANSTDDEAPHDPTEAKGAASERPVAMVPPSGAEDRHEADSDLDELASVLSHLGLGGRNEDDTVEGAPEEDEFDDDVVVIDPDASSIEGIFPYHGADPTTAPNSDKVVGESVTEELETDEDDGEAPDGDLPGVLRRRSRGALARELRSLSD